MSDSTDRLLRRIGARVRSARTAKGLTQAQVAERIGLVRSSVANLEAGRQSMQITRLALLAEVLSLDLVGLVTPDDLPEPPKPHDVIIRHVFEAECRTCHIEISRDASYPKAVERKKSHIKAMAARDAAA